VARKGEERKVYKVSVGKPERKRPLENPRHIWENGIIAQKMVAVRTSETSVYLNETTRLYVPESCHLQQERCFHSL
jgi:hypothetical protein